MIKQYTVPIQWQKHYYVHVSVHIQNLKDETGIIAALKPTLSQNRKCALFH